ncbi:putative cyclic nucleotide-binding domain containing protein [Trypanosoma cruzi]|nr:putative cyclic nucleotide-binding domain containing protein [Trypanosoma cruzi]
MSVVLPNESVQQKNDEEGEKSEQKKESDVPLQPENDDFASDAVLMSFVPPIPVDRLENLEMSFSRRRSLRNCSGSISRNIDTECGVSLRSAPTSCRSSKVSSLRTKGSVPEGLDRAVAMVQTYPLMAVEGTAFENQILRHGAGESGVVAFAGRSLTSTSNTEETESSISDLTEVLGRLRTGSSAVLFASRLKRACMWNVIIVNVLAHRAWHESFRLQRLRAALELLLLPVLLRKRGEKKSGKGHFFRPHPRGPCVLRDDEGLKPQGNFIWEHSAFFRKLGNLKFCEEVAEIVVRYRYSAGDPIVSVGTPAQDAMYILISGNCDAIISSDEPNVPVRRSRLAVGEGFGGLYGGREVFTKLYRSISQCIVWVIKREEFESTFSQHADEHMKNAYLDALKKHNMEHLLRDYPMPQCMSRVPIYRRIDGLIEEYAKDFVPIVLTKGDILFEQGDRPGDVYCLVEGHVQREQIGADMRYETGTKQIVSPNESDNNFSLSTRFVLLGEEPHILPGLLRYRCTVFSRAALFYKIKGERFVDALLDDAKLFLYVRERLTAQIRQSMRISPDALAKVPLLREMPTLHLNAIANAAEPRVVERCISICDPAQSVREIYLVVSGDVRDPRNFNRTTTLPMSPPASEDEEAVENTNTKGKKEKNVKIAASGRGKGKGTLAVHSPNETLGVRSPHFKDSGTAFGNAETTHFQWHFFHRNSKGEFSSGVIYPDEQHELTPPLPPNPAKNFICTVGGGWEGLLLEKWPNGWETTNTVELWAIPTLTIRTEFNSLPKSLQNSILMLARTTQMHALCLPSIVVAKLPPMSSFLPPEKRLTKQGLGIEKSPSQEKSAASHSRKYAGSGQSHERSTATGSRRGRAAGDLSGSHASILSGSSAFFSTNDTSGSKRKNLPKLTSRPPGPDSNAKKSLRRWTGGKDIKKVAETKEVAFAGEETPIEAPKPKAGPPPLLFIRKNASKGVEKPPIITPEMCAIYAGQEPQKGIIQYPQLPENKRKVKVRNFMMPADQKPSWPVVAGGKKQWFQVVPSFAPLPGTIHNQSYIASVPNLLPNAALMVKRDKGCGEVLASQANYFAFLAHRKRQHEMGCESPSPPSTAEPKISSSDARSLSPQIMGRPVPGRHVYCV